VSGDQARVSVAVAVEPAVAFEIFTSEIDQWWRRGPKFRQAGTRRGLLHLEPRVGGRIFESIESEQGTHVIEVGQVRIWEPPARLVFSWRNANFAPHEATEVEVEFKPTTRGTTVTVTHRGWSTLRPDHPARHGQEGREFARNLGLWWGELMSSFRENVAHRSPAG
jgi:uncharacterized protein YndB with AHSA1/START domain